MTARQRAALLAVLLLGSLLVPVPGARAADNGFAPECTPAANAEPLTVGVVDCIRLDSAALGAITAFSYFIPRSCDPALGRECPVLYYLHGTGGSYREGVGSKGSAGNAWVRALTSGPGVDPRTVDDPWSHADPSTWATKDPIDMIIVSPHGRTLPGGFGPAPNQDPFWMDWNPRYAKDGDQPRYDTPPPRFESHLTDELVPFVDARFPTSGRREQRAMVGYSMGGVGSFHVGFKHPDTWSSLGMRSGPTLPSPVFAGEDAAVAEHVAIAPPAAVPYVRPSGPTATLAPDPLFSEVLYGSVATVGYGDIATDHVWWRQNQPADLATNVRAYDADGQQVTHLQYFVNDAVPRRAEDLTEPDVYAQFFETVIYPTNLWLESVFDRQGVERTFRVGPGDHSGAYGQPYFREQLEGQYARLRHWDGGGSPGSDAVRFDYRNALASFEVWGWSFSVDRDPVEFLNLTDVSCDALTLRGTGSVTVTVPARCHTGVGGERTFTVDLGPASAIDEPVGAGSSEAYGHTVTVALSRTGGACPPPSQAPQCRP